MRMISRKKETVRYFGSVYREWGDTEIGALLLDVSGGRTSFTDLGLTTLNPLPSSCA